jgi:uncharacterized membrane protein AbrB (regulator of aidB expression)
MIQTLAELAQRLGVNAAFVPIALAAALTAIVFLVPSIARWFEDGRS